MHKCKHARDPIDSKYYYVDERSNEAALRESRMGLGGLAARRHKAELQAAPGKSRQGGTPQGCLQLQDPR